jgi:tRNA dimethylallyltransferase
MAGVPHYLLDVANPKRRFDVAQYRRLALKAMDKIIKEGKTPILCGGTGFYIQAVIDGLVLPSVKPDWRLRQSLDLLSAEQLFDKLKKLDSRRAKSIDRNNKRRLIRALEIVMKTGKIVPALKKKPLPYPTLIIGVSKTAKELKKLIAERLQRRLRAGMIAETKKLHQVGIFWPRLEEFGLEYRWLARYLQNKIGREEMVLRLQKDIEHFAKRQGTWFKKDKRIKWIKSYNEAERLTKYFLK